MKPFFFLNSLSWRLATFPFEYHPISSPPVSYGAGHFNRVLLLCPPRTNFLKYSISAVAYFPLKSIIGTTMFYFFVRNGKK